MRRHIDWRVKALLQKALSGLPGGRAINYLLQSRIARSVPLGDPEFAGMVEMTRRQLEAFSSLSPTPLSSARFYQFGVGWDLLAPAAMAMLGVREQVVTDIVRGARQPLVADTLRRLQALLGVPLPVSPDAALDEVLDALHIRYVAPIPANQTGLDTESFDCVTSISVMEHIPSDELLPILRECHRLLVPGGLVLLHVDLNDHYAYFDRSIPYINFLRYSDRRFWPYNSSLHYQNRLRRPEYIEVISAAGFELLEVNSDGPRPEDARVLARMTLPAKFATFRPVDLLAQNLDVVCRKPQHAAPG